MIQKVILDSLVHLLLSLSRSECRDKTKAKTRQEDSHTQAHTQTLGDIHKHEGEHTANAEMLSRGSVFRFLATDCERASQQVLDVKRRWIR